MRSDTTFERLLKLWISVWNLVLENKRLLETVAAALQRIVFETKGYPRFKNWPEICKLGRTHHLLMMTLATVSSTKLDEYCQQLVAAFPQCFSSEEVAGPYPFSVILERARGNGKKEANSDFGADFPVSYGAIPENVPIQGFDKFGNNKANLEGPLLPKEINPDAPQGSTVVWEGAEFIVLENNGSCEELWLAPSECFRVDL